MDLSEFWETTPGEVGVVIYAASRVRADRLHLGVLQSFYGRAVSYESNADKREAFLESLRPGAKKSLYRKNDDLTASETARWQKYFAEQKVGHA